ncbi:hypothetical protein RAS_09560 [Rickettsia asiatica]|uniref:Uncharacterized protein n=1 Tax=Rickettsia asiatica TaxID=238800 RepID=A0A510GH73_9RICK|nr:hypothetical protein [Rickettsia asiatica]BBJ31847.1 hypothetical protein RAS_09560 [Rickettsia asiatica]
MKELIEFLDKRGLKDKADSLRKGGTMLALGGGDIGEQGARELARTLKANNSLTELYLSNNNIGKVIL